MRKILAGSVVALVALWVVATAPSDDSKPEPKVWISAAYKPPAALKLPDVEQLTRKLMRADRKTAASQLRSSRQVVAFFDNPRWRWMRAPRQEKCWDVPWQRTCTVARHAYRLHLTLAVAAQRKLDQTDPIIARLNRGLSGTPMEGLGKTLRDVGRRFDVSPFFMAAAAGTESSFGHAGCGNNPKNVWGLAACDGRWYVPYFETWDEAITFYASFLAKRWPSASSPYHYYGYAACDACWGRKTSAWMQSRFGERAFTKFPA